MTQVKIAISCIACLVVGLASSSQLRAGVVATATLVKDPANGLPFEGAEAALGAPWVSYLLEWEDKTQRSNFLALEVSINGPLHQRWIDSKADGVFESTPSDLDTLSGDSHLLAPNGSLFGAGPLEDNSGAGSPLADSTSVDYGVGTKLSGAWAIPSALRGPKAAVAYIVIPKGSESELDILVTAIFDESSELYETTLSVDENDFFPAVPEPASILLIAMGIPLVCGCSRRRICRVISRIIA